MAAPVAGVAVRVPRGVRVSSRTREAADPVLAPERKSPTKGLLAAPGAAHPSQRAGLVGAHLKRSVPFARMPNHDFLALDPEPDVDDPPVVYLSHDGESKLIAASFASFLGEWARLGYIGPELWFLEDFIDRRSGCLTSESKKAKALRELFGMPK